MSASGSPTTHSKPTKHRFYKMTETAWSEFRRSAHLRPSRLSLQRNLGHPVAAAGFSLLPIPTPSALRCLPSIDNWESPEMPPNNSFLFNSFLLLIAVVGCL